MLEFWDAGLDMMVSWDRWEEVLDKILKDYAESPATIKHALEKVLGPAPSHITVQSVARQPEAKTPAPAPRVEDPQDDEEENEDDGEDEDEDGDEDGDEDEEGDEEGADRQEGKDQVAPEPATSPLVPSMQKDFYSHPIYRGPMS